MARLTKLPFQSSKSHATSVFSLVHIDIWGPYRIPARGKYKYFLTLVDDCSRMTWLYLLQAKSEFLKNLNPLSIMLRFIIMHMFSQ